MFLFDVVDSLQKHKITYCLIGGYALALHNIVRATVDIDLLLHLKLDQFEKAELALKEIGLQSRLPLHAAEIIHFRKEYIEKRNLLAWSFVDFKNPTRQVDILLTTDVSKIKSIKVSLAGRKIPIASLENLLEMKLQAGRPQDLVDAQNIREKLNEKKK